jgi:vacuolar-type H+-ATPase subunit I/STV1
MTEFHFKIFIHIDDDLYCLNDNCKLDRFNYIKDYIYNFPDKKLINKKYYFSKDNMLKILYECYFYVAYLNLKYSEYLNIDEKLRILDDIKMPIEELKIEEYEMILTKERLKQFEAKEKTKELETLKRQLELKEKTKKLEEELENLKQQANQQINIPENIKENRHKNKNCIDCNTQIYKKSTRCTICANKFKLTSSIEENYRPSLEQLEEEVKTNTYKNVGIKYNVSATTIRSWIKQYKKNII